MHTFVYSNRGTICSYSSAVARAPNPQLRETRIISCVAVSIGQICFTLHCSRLFSYMKEYLAIDIGDICVHIISVH